MVKDRVLVVDDDRNIGYLIKEFLKTEGFYTLVITNGMEALNIIEDKKPGIVILDIMLPNINGVEILKRIREISSTPVIMLSAKNEVSDKTICLNLGADDYLTKPFGLEELYARIQAIFRRTRSGTDSVSSFHHEELNIDYNSRQVTYNGQEIQLTPLEYYLLRELTQNAGKVLTHEYLLTKIWGSEYRVEREYLHVYVGQLRSKIEKDPKHPHYIVTAPRIGYKFQMIDYENQ